MKRDASDRERRSQERKDSGPLQVVCRHAVHACAKLMPYGFQVLASAAGYTLGISATQVVGYCLRVSCATPVIGPCLGMLGVGFASSLAGQASQHARKLCEVGGNPLRPSWWQPMPVEEAVLDSVLGIIIFKAMGGRFSSLMPSDLRRPGALAFESIPAQSDEYAKPSVRRELVRMFRRDGCHHCGSKRPPVIGDHMPPNKLVYGSKAKNAGKVKPQKWLLDNPLVNKVQQGLGMRPMPGHQQRFFPQCQPCSLKQAGAMRHNKRILVMHFHGPRHRSEHLAGIFVGLRHNAPALPPPQRPPSAAPSERRTRAAAASVHRWAPMGLTASLADEPSGNSDVFCDDHQLAHQQHQPQHIGLVSHTNHPPSNGLVLAGGPHGLEQDQGPELLLSLDGWGPGGAAVGGFRRGGGYGAPPGVDASASSEDGAQMIEDAKRQAQAAFERHFKPGLDI